MKEREVFSMEQFKSVRYGFMFDDIVNKNIPMDKIKPDKDYEAISDEDDNNLNLFRKPLGTIESDLILLYDPIEERIFVAQVSTNKFVYLFPEKYIVTADLTLRDQIALIQEDTYQEYHELKKMQLTDDRMQYINNTGTSNHSRFWKIPDGVPIPRSSASITYSQQIASIIREYGGTMGDSLINGFMKLEYGNSNLIDEAYYDSTAARMHRTILHGLDGQLETGNLGNPLIKYPSEILPDIRDIYYEDIEEIYDILKYDDEEYRGLNYSPYESLIMKHCPDAVLPINSFPCEVDAYECITEPGRSILEDIIPETYLIIGHNYTEDEVASKLIDLEKIEDNYFESFGFINEPKKYVYRIKPEYLTNFLPPKQDGDFKVDMDEVARRRELEQRENINYYCEEYLPNKTTFDTNSLYDNIHEDVYIPAPSITIVSDTEECVITYDDKIGVYHAWKPCLKEFIKTLDTLDNKEYSALEKAGSIIRSFK